MMIALAAALAIAGAAASPSASPVVVPSATPFQPTDADLRALRDAVKLEMAGKGNKISFHFDRTEYLPTYDSLVHYVGIGDDGAITIMASYTYLQRLQAAHQEPQYFVTDNEPMVAAFVLGTMESGAAGPMWKAYYDNITTADNALPPGVQDRYRNRHAASDSLAHTILALP